MIEIDRNFLLLFLYLVFLVLRHIFLSMQAFRFIYCSHISKFVDQATFIGNDIPTTMKPKAHLLVAVVVYLIPFDLYIRQLQNKTSNKALHTQWVHSSGESLDHESVSMTVYSRC